MEGNLKDNGVKGKWKEIGPDERKGVMRSYERGVYRQ